MTLKTRNIALPFALALALGLPALVAAAAPSASPGATDATVRAEDAPAEYTITASAAPLKVGGESIAVVTITTRGGFHWNKEYPAKATVANPNFTTVDVKKTEFKQSTGDFASVAPTIATVTIPLTGKAPGRETLKVETRFSVCSDKMCLIKTASADVTLVVAD